MRTRFFKKGLAVVLSAVMVLGAPVALEQNATEAEAATTSATGEIHDSSVSVSDEVSSTDWWKSFSDYYRGEGDFSAEIDLTVNSVNGNNYYNCPSIVITSDSDRQAAEYVEYLVMRTDNWADGTLFNNGVATNVQNNNGLSGNGWWYADPDNSCVVGDLDTIKSKLVNSNIKYKIVRTGNSIKVTEIFKAAGSSDSYSQWTVISSKNLDEKIRFFIAQDNCGFTVNSFNINYSISLDKDAVTLAKDSSSQLIATTYKNNANLTWVSSNADIASVDENGNVTGKSAGNAKITVSVTGPDGKVYSDDCNVTVSGEENRISAVTLTGDKESLSINEPLKLTTSFTTEKEGNTTDDTTVTYLSSNQDVATVDNDGNVTALAAGTTTITATIAGHESNGYQLTVKNTTYVGASGWWKAWSKSYEIKNGKKLTVNISDIQTGTDVWNSVVAVFSKVAIDGKSQPSKDTIPGYAEYGAIRLDNHCWGDTIGAPKDNKCTFTGTSVDSAANIKGQAGEFIFSRDGNKITYEYKIDGINSTKYDRIATFEVQSEDEVHVFFTPDVSSFLLDNGNEEYLDNYYDISSFRGETFTAPTKEGKTFAGWYTDSTCSTPISSTVKTGTAYAKFVDSALLVAKAQSAFVREAATSKYTGKSFSADTFKLRLLSGIDSLLYENVGFKVSYVKNGEKGNLGDIESTSVFEEIDINDCANQDKSLYEPTKHFGASVNYMNSALIYDIPAELVNENEISFAVTPYWTTNDGTLVTGDVKKISGTDIASYAG